MVLILSLSFRFLQNRWSRPTAGRPQFSLRPRSRQSPQDVPHQTRPTPGQRRGRLSRRPTLLRQTATEAVPRRRQPAIQQRGKPLRVRLMHRARRQRGRRESARLKFGPVQQAREAQAAKMCGQPTLPCGSTACVCRIGGAVSAGVSAHAFSLVSFCCSRVNIIVAA